MMDDGSRGGESGWAGLYAYNKSSKEIARVDSVLVWMPQSFVCQHAASPDLALLLRVVTPAHWVHAFVAIHGSLICYGRPFLQRGHMAARVEYPRACH